MKYDEFIRVFMYASYYCVEGGSTLSGVRMPPIVQLWHSREWSTSCHPTWFSSFFSEFVWMLTLSSGRMSSIVQMWHSSHPPLVILNGSPHLQKNISSIFLLQCLTFAVQCTSGLLAFCSCVHCAVHLEWLTWEGLSCCTRTYCNWTPYMHSELL